MLVVNLPKVAQEWHGEKHDYEGQNAPVLDGERDSNKHQLSQREEMLEDDRCPAPLLRAHEFQRFRSGKVLEFQEKGNSPGLSWRMPT